MTSLHDTLNKFKSGEIDKPTFIEEMYNSHHSKLFDYASYLPMTNISRLEIEDGKVVAVFRDRGIKMVCAEKDHRIAPIETINFFDYEKNELKMIEALTPNSGTFFDVGANFGLYSIYLSRSRRDMNFVCFEPIVKTYNFLLENIALNNMQNIKCHNFGLSDKDGVFTFYYYPEGSGNASGANLSGRDDVISVQCQLTTMDDYTARTGKCVDFIKCDVEGAELMVFKGGEKTISRDLPIIFSEILRKWSGKFGYNPNEIFSLLSGLGYSSFSAEGDYLVPFEVMDELSVQTNFFFLHQQKHAEQIRRYGKQ